MTALFSAEAVVAVILWAIVVSRFIKALRMRRTSDHWRPTWGLWLIFLCNALSMTAHVPAVRSLFAAQVGEWFETVPRDFIAITSALVGAELIYTLVPHLRPRWNWLLVSSLLLTIAYPLLLWAASIDAGRAWLNYPIWFYRETAANAMFNCFALAFLVRLVLPMLAWLRQQEQQPAMRMRLAVLTGMMLGYCVWLINGTAYGLALVLGVPSYPHDLIYVPTLLVVLLCFGIAYFAPVSFFVRLIQIQKHILAFWVFVLIRPLEIYAAYWTGRGTLPITLAEAFRMPHMAVYRSAIAVLDAHKPLKSQSIKPARILALQLDTVAHPDLDYEDVIVRLSQIGRGYLRAWLPRLPAFP